MKHFLLFFFACVYIQCIAQETSHLNTTILKGTWVGTLTKSLADLSDLRTFSLTMIHKGYDANTEILETVQLTENRKENKIDTLKASIKSYLRPGHIVYVFVEDLPNNKQCPIFLKLDYSFINGYHYLVSDNNESDCYKIKLSLKKVSDETEITSTTPRPVLNGNLTPPINNTDIKKYGVEKQPTSTSLPDANEKAATDKGLSPVAAQLFKTIRLLSENREGAIVNLTISNDDKNAIASLSGLTLNENGTLFLEKGNVRPFEAYLEAYDFNDDGLNEVILWKNNKIGPKMTNEFIIFNKPVLTYQSPSITKYRSVLKAYGTPVITKKKTIGYYDLTIGGLGGETAPSYIWDESVYRFRGNVPVSDKLMSSYLKNAVGGATPDELGRNLLKALQTNNKQLWINCLHPVDFSRRERCEKSFKAHRDGFIELGLTQWNLVKFSRVTFIREKPEEDWDNSGEKKCYEFAIEFTYKNNEFLGVSADMLIKTYKNENYFVYSINLLRPIQLVRYKK